MKQTIATIAVFSMMVLVPMSMVHAQTTVSPSLQETIQALLKQVEALQQQLAALRGEVQAVREEIRTQLREGMTGEEVEKLQALLASDPEIYPEGLETGYFGTLTKSALARFQARHQLPVTGEVDEATKELLNEYFKERGNGQVPPGLLRAPGIQEKIERRLANGCDDARGMAFLCKRLQGKFDIDDDVDVDDAKDAIKDAKEELEKAEEKVTEAEAEGTEVSLSRDALLEAEAYLAQAEEAFDLGDYGAAETAADAAEDLAKDARMKFLGKTEADLDEDDDTLEIEVEIKDGVAEVEIEYADGSETELTITATDKDEIITAIVNETDLTEEEVRASIVFDDDDDDDDDDDV